MEDTELISQKKLCEMLGVSRFAIYRAIKAGKLQPIKKGVENYFTKEAIDNWLIVDSKK